MRPKRGIIFASAAIAVLVIVMALLVNHIICQNGTENETLLKIDSKAVDMYNSVAGPVKAALDYIVYLYKKVTAIDISEYPDDNLPLYSGSSVIDYSFDESTNNLFISSGTNDSYDNIVSSYKSIFADDITVYYLKQYENESKYTAYGMIGNFIFLLEVMPSQHKKYDYEINTQLNYLKGDDLKMENFYRLNVGSNSYLYSNPYIYMYMMPKDSENIYLQLRDYKSQLLNINTHVELYIDDELYSSRYYGDTIAIPIRTLNEIHTIRMVSFDNKGCVRAIDELENALCYDASNQVDLYDLASYHSSTKNLFIYNSGSLENIGYFQYFDHLESLYFKGNYKIDDYMPILNLSNLSELYLDNVNNILVNNISQNKSLNVLELSNIDIEINLGTDYTDLQCSELIINNCSNLVFEEYGLFSTNLERLEIDYNYSLTNLDFISVYPRLHMLDISNCDKLLTLHNTHNLPNLNILSVNDCAAFDLSQPMDNMNSLMSVRFDSTPSLASYSDEYVNSIWVNNQLINYNVKNCDNIDDLNYYYEVWKAGQ